MRFKDKVAIVTGAAQGLGEACARRFLEEGASVVLADNNADALEATGDALSRLGALATQPTDVSRRAEVDALVAAAVARFGRVDILVNNAGIAHPQDLLEITEADFDTVIGVNLKGAFFGVQAAARQMIAQGGGGAIINISSVNARLVIPNLATYAMSKGGLNQLTAVAAIALAPHRIRVNGIGPGTILTDMVRKVIFSSDAAREAVMSRTPVGRCGEPREIAAVAAFLASDDASYMAGQTIYPDGGRMVLNYTVPVAES